MNRHQCLVAAVVAVLVSSGAAAQQGSRQEQLPAGQLTLATVSIPRPVLADGKPLPAGRYTLRLTGNYAEPPTGISNSLERWVEFVQGGTVRGRELASIVPAGEEDKTMAGPDMPGRMGRSGSRVEMLKGGEYLRIWIARADHDYLIHLPPQRAGR